MLEGLVTAFLLYLILFFFSIFAQHSGLLVEIIISGVLLLIIICLFSIALKKKEMVEMSVNLFFSAIVLMFIENIENIESSQVERTLFHCFVISNVAYSMKIEAIKGYCIVISSLIPHPLIQTMCKKYLTKLENPFKIKVFREYPELFLVAVLLILLKLHL